MTTSAAVNNNQALPKTILEDTSTKTAIILGNLAKLAFAVGTVATAILLLSGSASVPGALYGLKVVAVSSFGSNILFNTLANYLFSSSIDNAKKDFNQYKSALDAAQQENSELKEQLETIKGELADAKTAVTTTKAKVDKANAYSQKLAEGRRKKEQEDAQKKAEKNTEKSDDPIPMLRRTSTPEKPAVKPPVENPVERPKPTPVNRVLNHGHRNSEPIRLLAISPETGNAPASGVKRSVLQRSQTYQEQLKKDADSPPPLISLVVNKNALSENHLCETFKSLEGNLTDDQWISLSTAFDMNINGMPQDDAHKEERHKGICDLLTKCTGYNFDVGKQSHKAKHLLNLLFKEIFSRTQQFTSCKEKIIPAILDHMDKEMTLDALNNFTTAHILNKTVPNDRDDSLKLLIQKFYDLCMKDPVSDSVENFKPLLLGIVLQIAVQGSAVNNTWLSIIMKDLYERKILNKKHFEFCFNKTNDLFRGRIQLLKQRIPFVQIAIMSLTDDYDFSYEPTEQQLDKVLISKGAQT